MSGIHNCLRADWLYTSDPKPQTVGSVTPAPIVRVRAGVRMDGARWFTRHTIARGSRGVVALSLFVDTSCPDGSTFQTTGCTGDQNQAGDGEKDE